MAGSTEGGLLDKAIQLNVLLIPDVLLSLLLLLLLSLRHLEA